MALVVEGLWFRGLGFRAGFGVRGFWVWGPGPSKGSTLTCGHGLHRHGSTGCPQRGPKYPTL